MKEIQARKLKNNLQAYQDKFKQTWACVSKKEMLQQYPDGGYRIVGDFYDDKAKFQSDLVLVVDENKHFLHKYSGDLAKKYQVVGYIPTKQADEYVRIIIKKKSPLIALGIIATLLLMMFIGGMWLGKKDEKPQLDDSAVAYNITSLENKDPDQVMLPGIDAIYATTDSTKVKTVLLNPKGNDCNFVYTLRLKKNGEVLYTSKQIKPGFAIVNLNLNRKLAPGKYPLRVETKCYDTKDRVSEFNGGAIETTLIVRESK